MKAMVLHTVSKIEPGANPLTLTPAPDPVPKEKEVLVRVSVCAVCHTELDEIEGRTPPPRFPVIPGHQVVGRVEGMGKGVTRLTRGNRVGLAWIYRACGECRACLAGNENLCEKFVATGRDVNGGYAGYVTAHEDFVYPIPEVFTDAEAAPHLCAGAIGYRSLKLTGIVNGQTLGLTGFGASGHLVLKLARHRFPESKIYVFARNERERTFAHELGAAWAGESGEQAPEPLDAVIDTTPAWKTLVDAMAQLRAGGRLVVNVIRKEEADKQILLSLDYARHLWMEKEIKSVANITRADVREFLSLAAAVPIRPEVQEYPLEEANRALLDLKKGNVRGAKVLRVR